MVERASIAGSWGVGVEEVESSATGPCSSSTCSSLGETSLVVVGSEVTTRSGSTRDPSEFLNSCKGRPNIYIYIYIFHSRKF